MLLPCSFPADIVVKRDMLRVNALTIPVLPIASLVESLAR